MPLKCIPFQYVFWIHDGVLHFATAHLFLRRSPKHNSLGDARQAQSHFASHTIVFMLYLASYFRCFIKKTPKSRAKLLKKGMRKSWPQSCYLVEQG